MKEDSFSAQLFLPPGDKGVKKGGFMMAGGQVIRGNFPPPTPPVKDPGAGLPPVQGEQTLEASPPEALDEYVGDDEPAEFNPAMRFLKNIFRPIRDFFRWIGRGFRSSHKTQSHETQPQAAVDVQSEKSVPNYTVRSQAGGVINVKKHGDGIFFSSINHFDIANLLEIIESDGRQTHKPLSQIVDAMMMRRFAIAGMFGVTPTHDSSTHSYGVNIWPLNNSVSFDRLYTAVGKFKRQAEREIVTRVNITPGTDPSLEDIHRTLTGIFNSEFHQYAKRLGVDEDSGDPRFGRMLNIESMISESAPSGISLGAFVRILEVGVRTRSDGEVEAFILRFVKGGAPIKDEVDFNNVVTWVGKINESADRITWYYHEIIRDPNYVTGSTSPVFEVTEQILGELIPFTSWDPIKYGVEIDVEGSGGRGSGGQTPGSPVTPATPATGAPAAGSGPVKSASAAPIDDEDMKIMAVLDQDVVLLEDEGSVAIPGGSDGAMGEWGWTCGLGAKTTAIGANGVFLAH